MTESHSAQTRLPTIHDIPLPVNEEDASFERRGLLIRLMDSESVYPSNLMAGIYRDLENRVREAEWGGL